MRLTVLPVWPAEVEEVHRLAEMLKGQRARDLHAEANAATSDEGQRRAGAEEVTSSAQGAAAGAPTSPPAFEQGDLFKDLPEAAVLKTESTPQALTRPTSGSAKSHLDALRSTWRDAADGPTMPERRVARNLQHPWAIGAPIVALLVSTGILDGEQRNQLVGAARVIVHPPGRLTSDQKIDIDRVELFDCPLNWADVLQGLPEQTRRWLNTSLTGQVEMLLPAITRDLHEAVLQAAEKAGDAALRDTVSRALTDKRQPRARRVSNSLGQDMFRTVIRITNMTDARRESVSEQSFKESWEAHFINHDNRAFDPSWTRQDARNTWWLFTKDDRRLYMIQGHAAEGERSTGGDIIYVRTDPPSMVAVQYKRLTSAPGSPIVSCSVDPDFLNEMDKLISMTGTADRTADRPCTTSDTPAMPLRSIDFRMLGTSGFFKLIDSRETQENTEELFRGVYLPAEYLKLLLAESASKPLDLDTRKDRHIDTETFVRLVGGGWVGTVGKDTAALLAMLPSFVRDNEPYVIAVETPNPPSNNDAGGTAEGTG